MGLWLKKSDGTVVEINSDGIAEAPEDGKQYARQDAAWSEVEAAEVLRGDPNNPPADWATDQLLYDGIEDDGSGGGGGSFEGEHVPTGDPSDPATLDMVDEGQLLYDGVEGGGSGGGGPHDHDYLPLSGGTLTGDLQVDGNVNVGTTKEISFGQSSVGGQQVKVYDGTGGTYGIGVEDRRASIFAGSTEVAGFYNDLQTKLKGDLQVDGNIGCYFAGSEAVPAIWFAQSDRAGFYALQDQLTVTMSGQWKTAWMPDKMQVGTNLQVDGTISGSIAHDTHVTGNLIVDNVIGLPSLRESDAGLTSILPNLLVDNAGWVRRTTWTPSRMAFAPSKLARTNDVLDRAETATLPPEIETDEEGNQTNTAEVEAHDTVQLFDVVTALLAKVKELSAEIEELKKGA